MADEAESDPVRADIDFRGSLVWTAGNYLAPFLYTAVVSIVAARVLGPDGMGRQNYIAFVALTIQTIATVSLGYAITREVAARMDRPDSRTAIAALLHGSWRLITIASVFGATLLGVAAALGASPVAAWWFAALAVLLGGLSMLPGSALQGARRWRVESMGAVASGMAGAIFALTALAVGWGITGLMAGLALAAACRLAWNYTYMRRLHLAGSARRSAWGPAIPTLRRSLDYLPSVLLSFIVLQRSEVFFLNHYSTNSEIAHFSIAFSLVVALAAAPRAVEVFVLPSVATLIQAQDEERIARGIARMLRLASLVTIPLTIAALTFGPSIIRLLYGQEYADTGTVFLVLVVQLPLVPLVAGGTALLMAYGTRTRALIASYAVAASINVLMAWALIPHYGAYGAAAANLAGVVTLAALILRSCLRVLGPFSFGWGTIGRMTAASLLGAVAAAPVLIVGEGGIPLLLAGAIGLTSFVAALFVIRPLTREDSEWISRLPTAHSRRVVQPMLTRMSRSGDELDSAPL